MKYQAAQAEMMYTVSCEGETEEERKRTIRKTPKRKAAQIEKKSNINQSVFGRAISERIT